MQYPADQIDPGEISSGTPLQALTAVCIDTETTGLDVRRERLIQLGGVKIIRGRIQQDGFLDTLINPGQPVPPASTRIHGLTDADVASAVAFAEYYQTFEQWVGDAIVLGYSIGFDLAILNREYALAELPFPSRRTIDVAHMVQILAPPLPDYALETVAVWLSLPSARRHQALGDAIITAQVFKALVPLLHKKGIRTVAELEYRCRNLMAEQEHNEIGVGWYDFMGSTRPRDWTQQPYARIDSYPYRHRVCDILSEKLVIMDATATVAAALAQMMEQKISSVIVDGRNDGPERGHGILTERDVLRLFHRHGAAAGEAAIGAHANFPLLQVNKNAFLYRAIGKMTRYQVRHLGVVDRAGEVVGVISSRDLLRQRGQDAVNLGDAINHAETYEDLGVVWANIAIVARALANEEVDARDIAAVISRELRALTRRSCQLAEQAMRLKGRGGPPVPYAMLVLGSGGRGESLLAMDQDNAIVYADRADDAANAENDKWFADLARRVSKSLDMVGVPYCKGGIMAMNADWRMPLSRWKASVSTWVTRTTPEDILKTDIFYDAACVHGDYALAHELMKYALEVGAAGKQYLHLIALNSANVKSPLGSFGRFRLKGGRVDVKMGGILPIFSAARVQAIRHHVVEKSTPGRLAGVRSILTNRGTLIDNLTEAHRIILGSILQQQLDDLDNGIALSNRIAPETLTSAQRNSLKWALEQVPGVADLLGVPLRR